MRYRLLRALLLVVAAVITACSGASEPLTPFTHDVNFAITQETYFARGRDPACPYSNGDMYCTAWRDADGSPSGSLSLARPYVLTIDGLTYVADALGTDSSRIDFYRTSEYTNCQAIVIVRAVSSGGVLHGTWTQATGCHGLARAGTLTVR